MKNEKNTKNIFVLIGKPMYVVLRNILGKLWRITLMLALLTISIGGYIFYKDIIKTLPKIENIEILPPMSSKIVDESGHLLYKFYKDENRSWIGLDQIPQSLIWATISVEDKEFYTHNGISPKGIIRALIYNITNEGGLRGGSTITQQLVKNVFLTNEKTWQRKAKEIVLSVLIELRLSKNEILERYFNQVPYGGEAYGVQEASLRYFGKNVWEISMAEAAFLAGLPAAPSVFSPYTDMDKAIARQHHVIVEMEKAGYINEVSAREIASKGVEIVNDRQLITYPHFVFFVRDWVENNLGIDNIEKRGLTIVTTIDSKIQDEASQIVADEVDKAKRLKISNGASVVIEASTGKLLAMVGSKDYWSADIDGKFNVTLSPRQPGSSIKPINYSLALLNGKTLLSPIDDSPVSYKIPGQEDYVPKNYNGKYAGKVTLKQALASSLNIPSVKLLDEHGVDNMIELAEKMGITTWQDKSRFGLSLALGAGEVKMIDMASAYSTFANLGDRVIINPVIEIRNYLGEVVYKSEVNKERVLDPKVAFLINEALSDDVARRLVFSPGSLLNIKGKKVAVKTGTTNSLRDNWCVGWTPTYLVVAWVGNNDNSPMSWVASGISGATPIWHRIMNYLLTDTENEDWPVPEGVSRMNICGKSEYFVEGSQIPGCFWTTPTPIPTQSN